METHGCGKTTIARIIGKIFSEEKILSDKGEDGYLYYDIRSFHGATFSEACLDGHILNGKCELAETCRYIASFCFLNS